MAEFISVEDDIGDLDINLAHVKTMRRWHDGKHHSLITMQDGEQFHVMEHIYTIQRECVFEIKAESDAL